MKRYSFDPQDYLERGLGGSESTLVLLAQALASNGHKVEVYNCCFKEGNYKGVDWKNLWRFDTTKHFDAVVSLRLLETFKTYNINSSIKAVWLHDESIKGAKKLDEDGTVNMWIFISETQKNIIQDKQNLKKENCFLTHNAFDEDIYNSKLREIEKIKNRAIYCSAPDRGLNLLLDMWQEIKQKVPDASLVVTGSYSLWGISDEENERIFEDIYSLELEDVYLFKRIPKLELAKLQAESEVMLYPTNFNEMFCISALECLASGTPIITSKRGALKERIQNGINGFLIDEAFESNEYRKKFIECTISFFKSTNKRIYFDNSVKSISKMNFEELAKKWELEFTKKK